MEIDDSALIYSFIVNNDKLEKLELSQNKFNPFKVLKISQYEIRHSNVLAWLLNPNENHNLGDKILKKIILQILIDSNNQEIVPDNIDIKDVHIPSFSDARVYREHHHIDILVVSETNRFVLLIENKIYSQESKYQLKKYFPA